MIRELSTSDGAIKGSEIGPHFHFFGLNLRLATTNVLVFSMRLICFTFGSFPWC